MKFSKLVHLSLVLVTASLLAVGCSQTQSPLADGQDVSGDNTMAEVDLNKAYGGLSYTDEPEAFADDVLLADMAEDILAEADDDEDDVLEDDPGRDEYVRTYVRVLWGMLDGRPDGDEARTDAEGECEVVTWDGKMTVTDGAIALKRLIRFERPTDHRLPRENRQTVGWTSKTCPHVDGILVCILSPQDKDGNPTGSVSFETGPLTQTFSVAELAGLEETIAVDEMGNAVSFVGLSRDDRPCAAGFMRGRWKSSPNDELQGGWFRGRVSNEHGRLRGHMMGRYGVNDAGERVFAGKFIAFNGRILGLLGGTWEPSGDEDGAGMFSGRWVNRAGTHQGVLGGEYKTVPDRGAGFYAGRWEESCSSDEE